MKKRIETYIQWTQQDHILLRDAMPGDVLWLPTQTAYGRSARARILSFGEPVHRTTRLQWVTVKWQHKGTIGEVLLCTDMGPRRIVWLADRRDVVGRVG